MKSQHGTDWVKISVKLTLAKPIGHFIKIGTPVFQAIVTVTLR